MPRDRYTLKSIEIAGFRGYRDAKHLDLNAQACLFFGGNRSGKSSTLGAIEWCLFSEFASLKVDKTGTLDELVNDHSPRIMITLELQGPDGVVKVVRTKLRSTKKTKLEVTTPDGTVCRDDDARKTLYKLLGLEFDDFTRAVYLHQEDIRDLIVGDKDMRSMAMDRLLGLDQLRNISGGLKPKPIRDGISGVQTMRDGIVSAITGHLREANTHLEEAIEKAAQEGLTTSRLSLKTGHVISEGVFKSLAEIAGEAGLEVQKPELAENWKDLHRHAIVAQSIVRKVRGQLPEMKRINELTEELTKIRGLKSDYAATVSRCDIATKNVRLYEQKYGNETSIRKKIEEVKEKIKKLNEERDQVGAKQKIIKDGLRYLDEFTDVKKCPICKKPINRDNILDHLHKEAKEKIGKKLLDIDAAIEKEDKKREELEETLQGLKRLIKDKERAIQECDQQIVEVSAGLGRPIKAGEDVAVLLDAKLGEVSREIQALQKPLKDREEKFEDIESQVNQLLALAEVLNKKQRINELTKLQGSEELKKVDGVLIMLGGFEHTVNMIGDAVRELQTELAPLKVNKAMPAIRKIYNRLVAHPYYPEPQIEVEPSSRGTLKNVYHIKAVNPKDGAETLVSQRFSTGDMNCVALSVFLGLAEQDAYSHKANFLIIDDPSQNLEHERKEELVRNFAGIMRERQLFIASHDEDLQHLLSDTIDPKRAKTFTFGKWDEKGVKVRGS